MSSYGLTQISAPRLIRYLQKTGDKIGFLDKVTDVAEKLKKTDPQKLRKFYVVVRSVLDSPAWEQIKQRSETTFEQLLEYYLFEIGGAPTPATGRDPATTTINPAETSAAAVQDKSGININNVTSFSVQRLIDLARRLKDPTYVASKLYVLKKQFLDSGNRVKAKKIEEILIKLSKNPVWQQLKKQFVK